MSHAEEDHDETRRDFLYYATGGAGAIAVGAAVWPLVHQMNPSADVLAASTTEVDVSGIEAGQTIKAVFRKQPLFIKRLTEAEIASANEVDTSGLRDPLRNETCSMEMHVHEA